MRKIQVNRPSYIEEMYEEIVSLLNLNCDLFDENLLHEFEMNNRNLTQQIDEIFCENRLLKIGIVGEVKAGKSSFLNALLFNGKQILPKAATPMTAALTKIKYSDSEKSGGKIIFYDQKDWELIERKSTQYQEQVNSLRSEFENSQRVRRNGKEMGFNEESFKRYIEQNISPDLKGCNELVEMVNKSHINPYDYLGKIHQLHEADKVEDCLEELKNYVGVDGKYTPLVKHTELMLNLPILEGIEVVDTPGTNDPIISRGMTTRDFLGECDVIFLLSYAGQFLTNEDVNFIVSILPDKGIKNAILVGSKFDSAILDNNKIKNDFILAFKETQKKLAIHAKQTLQKHLKESAEGPLKEIYQSMPPIFISSLFYNIAQKDLKNLTEDEEHILNVFKLRYETFKAEKKSLILYSRIDDIKTKKLDPIINKKELIMSQSILDFEFTKLKEFSKKISSIRKNVESRSESIISYDLKEYEKERRQILQRLNKVDFKVKELFAFTKKDLKDKLKDLQIHLQEKKNNYSNINLEDGERSEKTIQKHWWHDKEITKKTYYKYIATTQVIKNLENYIIDIDKDASAEFKRLINLSRFKNKLKECISDTCDFNNMNFDEDTILIPVELDLLKLEELDLSLSIDLYKKMITDKYNDVIIEGDEIHRAVNLQQEVLNKIYRDVCIKIQQISEKIDEKFEMISSQFIKTVCDHLENTLDELKKQSEEKEAYLVKYEAFKRELSALEKKLTTMKSSKIGRD